MSAPTATPRLVLDNRVNVSDSFDALVPYSGVNVTQYEIQPDGTGFDTQILFQNIVTPNNATTLVSRNFRLRYDVVFTYDRTAGNKPSFAGVDDTQAGANMTGYNGSPNTVLRAPFALQSVCDNVALTINSQTFNLPSRIVNDAFVQKLSKDYLKNQASEAPSMLDNRYQLSVDDIGAAVTGNLVVPNNLANWAAVVDAGPIVIAINGLNYTYIPTGAAPPAVGDSIPIIAPNGYTAFAPCTLLWTAGAARTIATIYSLSLAKNSNQPLSVYENSDGSTRACFLPVSATRNGNIITVRFQVSENLFVSPLSLLDRETAFANLNTLSLLFSYSKLSDIVYSTVGYTPIVGNATNGVEIQSPVLQLTYMQVNPDVVKIPASVTYPYEQVIYFQKSSTMTLAAYPAVTELLLTSDTYRLNACPSKIYIFARKPITSRANDDTQTFYGLGHANYSATAKAGISLTFGNRTGLLTSASNQTMYRMSKKNGYTGSFNEWMRSGLYIIDPVQDLGIDPNIDFLPLEVGNEQLQFNCYANNWGQVDCGVVAPNGQIELMTVIVYAASCSITPDMCYQSMALLSNNEMKALIGSAGKEGNMVSSEHVKPTIQGQGLFGDAKHLLGKMASAVRSPIGQKALEMMSKLK